MDNKDIQQYNREINKWKTKVLSGLTTLSMRFTKGKKEPFVQRNNRSEQKLIQSINSRIRKNAGTIESISFRFERHGIFVEKGVSKSHSLSNLRKKRPWIQPVFNRYTPEIADKVAEMNANNVIKLKQ
jgi:hypothetical protein